MLKKLTVAAFAVLLTTGALQAQNVAYKTWTADQVKANVDKMMSKINWGTNLNELKKKAKAEKSNSCSHEHVNVTSPPHFHAVIAVEQPTCSAGKTANVGASSTGSSALGRLSLGLR